MKKILYINHSFSEKCGVYDLGRRHFDCISKIENYNFLYKEIKTIEEYKFFSKTEKPNAILINWMPSLFHWTNRILKNKETKIFCIPHLVNPFNKDEYLNFLANHKNIFDYAIMLDPTSLNIDCFFKTDRPLINFESIHKIKNDIPTIGSFGFAFEHKRFDLLVTKVNFEFDNAIINFNISEAHFNGDIKRLSRVIDACKSKNINNKIKLNFNTNFLSDFELLKELNKNDINCLFYEDQSSLGISSSLDYLVSAQKPIMLSFSKMFRSYSDNFPKYNISLKSVYDDFYNQQNNCVNVYKNSFNKILNETKQIFDRTLI